MAPKKKEREYSSISQPNLDLSYPIKSSENNIPNNNYPETILHRLRPRPHRLLRASEMVYKVCASRTRRKRRRLPVKRCFIQYKRKRRYRGYRNRSRVNPSQKPAGDFRSKSIFTRTGPQPAETSVPNLPHDRNRQKPMSLIQSIKDYIFSTFREGTKWAKKYVWKAFGSNNKSGNSSTSVSRKEEKNAISCSSSRVIQPGQSDYKDKTSRRYKTTNNQHQHQQQQQQRGDGVSSRFNGNGVTSRGCGRNSPIENPGNFPIALDGKYRHSNPVANPLATSNQANDTCGNLVNEHVETKLPNRRRRRKRSRRNKRIACSVRRNEKVGKKPRDRNSSVRSNSLGLINLTISTASLDLQIENDEFAEKFDTDLDESKEEIEVDERPSQEIIFLGQSLAPEKDPITGPSRNDKFSKPSRGDNSFEKNFENEY